MPAPRQRGRTPPDGGYGIRENPRQDVWGTGEPVVHEDEWTVGQAAQAPQERNRVESKEYRQFAAIAVRAEPRRRVMRRLGTRLVGVNHATGLVAVPEPEIG